jgi:lipopolysaccharide assembly protein A
VIRYLWYLFLALFAIALVTVALANAAPVTLRLLPEAMAGFMGLSWEITLPLFLVVFGGIAVGLLVGFVWEWWREHRYRSEMRAEKRARQRLEREMAQMRTSSRKGDDVLALLEDGSVPR